MSSEIVQAMETNKVFSGLNLHDIVMDTEGVFTISISVPDSFKQKFKEEQNMKRFTKKRFKSWFIDQLQGFEEVT